MELSANFSIFIAGGKEPSPSASELQRRLESPQDSVKAEAMEQLIAGMIRGERYDKLLMPVIRFCVPCSCKRVKKLTFLFLEIVDKCDAQGKLREEVILVCNALRNDLMSPNEYVRGSALRLAGKIRQAKVVEPLLEAILKNLTHRHSYVRRNAVLCVLALLQHFGPDFIPAAAEHVDQLLVVEGDAGTRRAAFLLLLHCDVRLALRYVLEKQQSAGADGEAASVLAMGEAFQLALLELLRRIARLKQPSKPALLRLVVGLLPSSPPSVAYEGASCVLSLRPGTAALKAACGALCQLLHQQTEYNVKLVVLDRIGECLDRDKDSSLEEFVIDVLRGLQTTSLEVRRRTVEMAVRMVGDRTSEQVVSILKKHLAKLQDAEATDSTTALSDLRCLLLDALYFCACKFPALTLQCLSSASDLLSETGRAATRAAQLLRQVAVEQPSLRNTVVNLLLENIKDIRNDPALRMSLWLVGEYCCSAEVRDSFLELTYTGLLPLPLDAEGPEEEGAEGVGTSASKATQPATRTVILEDGTYGTESVVPAEGDLTSDDAEGCRLFREKLLEGDSLLAATLAVTITKLLLLSSPVYVQRRAKGFQESGNSLVASNSSQVLPVSPLRENQGLFIVASLLKQARALAGDTSDAALRITQCLRALLALRENPTGPRVAAACSWFLTNEEGLKIASKCESAGSLSFSEDALSAASTADSESPRVVPSDASIDFRLIRPVVTGESAEDTRAFDAESPFLGEDEEEDFADFNESASDSLALSPQLAAAVGATAPLNETNRFHRRLAAVRQMTGMADEVYVEGCLLANQFDLSAELFVSNRTDEVLTNVSVELSTHGDVQLVERPTPVTLGPGESTYVLASLKVRSTEASVVFGLVTFEKFVEPRWIDELTFRGKWAEFEWENKVLISAPPIDACVFLEELLRHTHMTVVGSGPRPRASSQRSTTVLSTSERRIGSRVNGESERDAYIRESLEASKELHALAKHSSVFAVNLYSRSVFGEDALANLSLERLPCGRLSGCVRIRSRTQGVALSVGDRIAVLQRKVAVSYG